MILFWFWVIDELEINITQGTWDDASSLERIPDAI
jgi:hypothetical protein